MTFLVDYFQPQLNMYHYFDEFRIYKELYSKLQQPNPNNRKFVPNEVFYRIETPFLMDSRAANWLNEKLGQSGGKRKRKRPSSSTAEAAPFLIENSRIVQAAFEAFIKSGHTYHGCTTDFSKLKDADIGNQEARLWVKNAPKYVPSATHISEDEDNEMNIVELTDEQHNTSPSTSAGNSSTLFRNGTSQFVWSKQFLIPPNSAHVLGDISLLNHFPKNGLVNFDFILMDPPWPNRTVKRQKMFKYKMFTSNDPFADQLGKIPIGELFKPDGLLCIWMTNSKVAHQGAERLLKHWGMTKLAEWHWLKICKSNDPICQFRPEHKVPFESLLFATWPDATDKFAGILDNFCLISVPNAFPSRKPPISLLLEQMGLIEPIQQGLELFGRYLLPNFTTIGNEANKFQDEYYFKQQEA